MLQVGLGPSCFPRTEGWLKEVLMGGNDQEGGSEGSQANPLVPGLKPPGPFICPEWPPAGQDGLIADCVA